MNKKLSTSLVSMSALVEGTTLTLSSPISSPTRTQKRAKNFRIKRVHKPATVVAAHRGK